jgi:hypothetical protein|tara:strand:+ start:605 stop:1087 length:483 start_codon:yes stop_codon:yes gene_type:complete
MPENTRYEEEQDPRASRDLSTREVESRNDDSWIPQSVLPTPHPQEGWVFRWIRTSMRGTEDNANVSQKFREGWIPCKLEDHPELKLIPDIGTRWDGNAVSGGLMLCKNSVEKMNARREYMMKKNDQQMEAVDSNYMRDNDARMPKLNPDRRTRVSFGDGS